MSRECIDIEIKCPECQQDGKLTVSQNDYAFMNRLNRDIESIYGDFKAIMLNNGQAKIICEQCSKEFSWLKQTQTPSVKSRHIAR